MQRNRMYSALGGFDRTDAALHASYHREAQALLSSWCCTSDERFRRLAGLVPYVLPPLPGLPRGRGAGSLRWVDAALRACTPRSANIHAGHCSA